MIKKLLILFVFLGLTSAGAHAQELSTNAMEDQTFWSQEVDVNAHWGLWLRDVYRPYADKLSVAILKIVSSTINIDSTGKSSEELLEEINVAYNNSLRSMELIKAPAELKEYHSKIVELYRHTINSDPKEVSKNAIIRKQLSLEADQAITKAFQLHGVSQKIIDRFTED